MRLPMHRNTYHGRSVSARWLGASAVLLLVGQGSVERAAAQDPAQDPEVLAAVSEAMSNPISSLISLDGEPTILGTLYY